MTTEAVRARNEVHRPVRVTILGVARKLAHADSCLIVTRADGGKVVIPESAPGVVVEYVDPSYQWTDGDVVISTHYSYHRVNGAWNSTGGAKGLPDADMEAGLRVHPESFAVARYQAGDL